MLQFDNNMTSFYINVVLLLTFMLWFVFSFCHSNKTEAVKLTQLWHKQHHCMIELNTSHLPGAAVRVKHILCCVRPPQALGPCCLTSCHRDHSRFIDGDVSTDIPGRALVCEDGKHFLFISVESDADGGLHEAQAAKRDDSQQTAGDRWLVAKVLDTITVDWTWFGTLCVLLWLLYLMLL